MTKTIQPKLKQPHAESAHELFPGLTQFLGALLLIGFTHEPEQTLAFIKTLDPAVMAELFPSIGIFFAKTADGHRFGIAPPAALTAWMSTVATSGPAPLGSRAASALAFVSSLKRSTGPAR